MLIMVMVLEVYTHVKLITLHRWSYIWCQQYLNNIVRDQTCPEKKFYKFDILPQI